MRPRLQNRRVVEVLAGIAWESTPKHRVYSCPDLPAFNSVLNATALVLRNTKTGPRVPLEVIAVEKFVPDNLETELHAVQDGGHFTHSGGLVAVHPVVHHLAHKSELLKGLLRREAFLRFGYDPLRIFEP